MLNCENLRGFKVTYIKPTDFKGSGIKIKDLLNNKTIHIKYNSKYQGIKEESLNFLNDQGLNIVYYCEIKTGYIMLSKNFNIPLMRIIGGFRGIKKDQGLKSGIKAKNPLRNRGVNIIYINKDINGAFNLSFLSRSGALIHKKYMGYSELPHPKSCEDFEDGASYDGRNARGHYAKVEGGNLKK